MGSIPRLSSGISPVLLLSFGELILSLPVYHFSRTSVGYFCGMIRGMIVTRALVIYITLEIKVNSDSSRRRSEYSIYSSYTSQRRILCREYRTVAWPRVHHAVQRVWRYQERSMPPRNNYFASPFGDCEWRKTNGMYHDPNLKCSLATDADNKDITLQAQWDRIPFAHNTLDDRDRGTTLGGKLSNT